MTIILSSYDTGNEYPFTDMAEAYQNLETVFEQDQHHPPKDKAEAYKNFCFIDKERDDCVCYAFKEAYPDVRGGEQSEGSRKAVEKLEDFLRETGVLPERKSKTVNNPTKTVAMALVEDLLHLKEHLPLDVNCVFPLYDFVTSRGLVSREPMLEAARRLNATHKWEGAKDLTNQIIKGRFWKYKTGLEEREGQELDEHWPELVKMVESL